MTLKEFNIELNCHGNDGMDNWEVDYYDVWFDWEAYYDL